MKFRQVRIIPKDPHITKLGRKTFSHKRGEILIYWRKWHSERLHCFCSSLNIFRLVKSKQKRWEKHVACIGERETHKDFTGKPEENRHLGTDWNRWEDDIKMHFKEIVGVGVGGFGSA